MPIKVLLVSNWNDQCGISTYGNNLLIALSANEEVEVTPIEISDTPEKLFAAANEADVVHINWQYGISRVFNVDWMSKCESPLILTNHYTEWKEGWYKYLARIVTHIDEPEGNVVYIPHGAVSTELSDRSPEGLVIGQGGLPGKHKMTEVLCRAARKIKDRGIEVSVYIVAPASYRSDAARYVREWRELLGDIKITTPTEWMDEYTAIQTLHDNVSVCVHAGGNTGTRGISGSVRMSISTHRPVVVNSEGELYSDVLDVEGIYPYTGEENLADTILEAYGNVGPEQFAKDNSYQEIIKQYISLYKEVM